VRYPERPLELGLTPEEAAFYDALAGHAGDWKADAQLADLARKLVQAIRADLTIDWANHESTEAGIRVKVKRLLRQARYQPPASGEQWRRWWWRARPCCSARPRSGMDSLLLLAGGGPADRHRVTKVARTKTAPAEMRGGSVDRGELVSEGNHSCIEVADMIGDEP
jgi:hypothetical protein